MSVPELAGVLGTDDVLATAATIAGAQERSGAIPWFTGGHLDPWDHVEAAMALDVAGHRERASSAYEWLRHSQRPDGSWAQRYSAGAVIETTAETNHAAYVAVGCWHHWLATGDDAFLARLWPTVRRAVTFVVSQQRADGVIGWALGDPGALLTGCASIHQSLHCANAIAEHIGEPQPDWELALARLGHGVRNHPAAFADKDRYSMDWYYPVLGGAVRGEAGKSRLRARWDDFVVPGRGARCVADQPWVTGAETCELALSLEAVGERAEAAEMVTAMQHLRETDGSYWTGLVLTDGVRWPVERTTWTAAAVILAVDALHGAHPRSSIFRTATAGTHDEPCSELECSLA